MSLLTTRKEHAYLGCGALLLVWLAVPAVAQQKSDMDPIALVRQASKNEIRATDQQNYFMFKDTIEYKDHSITRAVVRTPQGGLKSTLSINGHPLTAEERKKDD